MSNLAALFGRTRSTVEPSATAPVSEQHVSRRNVGKHFPLVRYFTITSFLIFVVVTAGLGYFQRQIAVQNMITQAEGNNVNLTHTLANILWDDFAPFLKQARTYTVDELRQAPELQGYHSLVSSIMKNSDVLKVKIFDLNGLTVYSSEAKQIGDDKSGNAGYLSAVKGVAASELTHRDTFSAFEQTIEDRDVLSSYIPVYNPKTNQLEGVFEIYADVSSFLAEINRTQNIVIGGVIGSLLLLYIVLFFIIKRADNIIRVQEEDRIKTQALLSQSDKMASMGQMVAGVAHQLNTPLAFVRSNVALVMEMLLALSKPTSVGVKFFKAVAQAPDDKKDINVKINADKWRDAVNAYMNEEVEITDTSELLKEVLRGIDQMEELVVNLRDFTRLDRAKVAAIDLNKGLDNVLYITRSVMSNKIQVHTEFDASLPKVQCSASQINQVFLNLINNAAQALGKEGNIWIRTVVEDESVRIEIEDDGPGIPEEVLPHIFEAYYTTKDEDSGTGLGLSIAKEIVNEHHGDIDVKSTEGAGTTFTVRLPISMDEH